MTAVRPVPTALAEADRALVVRKLEISDRHVWNAIHDMIQRDPMKALVELVTNADDSYARLEAKGIAVTGRIEIEVEEHRGARPSVLRVRDDAEGFDVAGIDTRVGRMGEATSGLLEGAPVRGVWGDGMKEAALGLGVGATVTSIRDGGFVKARLAWSPDREPMYAREAAARPATAKDRSHLDLVGNGTVIEVEVATGIAVPRHDRLVRDVGLHVALRDIVASPTRRVVVRRLGRVTEEDRAVFREPVRDPGLRIHEKATVVGYPDAEVELWMWPATQALSGAEDGPYRTGGLLVQSRRALVDCSFFGHDGWPGAERLWGRVRCDALHALLAAGEPVLARNRTGLARENPFVRALIRTIDAMVDPHVVAEEHLAEVIDVDADARSKRRFGDVMRELNRILVKEMREPVEASSSTLPFQFGSRDYRVGRGERSVRLSAQPGLLREDDVVTFAVDGEGFELSGPAEVVVEDPGEEEVVVISTSVRSDVVHALGTIRARCGRFEATARLVAMADAPAPPDLGFDAARHRIRVGRWTPVWISARAALAPRKVDLLPLGDFEVRPAQVVLEGDGPYLHARVEVRGMQIGATGRLVATTGERTAECTVDIVGRRDDAQVEGPLGEIHLDASPAPDRRVTVRESDGTIVIYVNAPSISAYVADPVDRDSPPGRAIMAELVLEAFCTHLALRKVDEGVAGDPARTVLAHIDRLQHAYGAMVHRMLAQP